MRKFILYFLLALLFISVAVLSYGFLNAKIIRGFAGDIFQIRVQYDPGTQIGKIEESFRGNGKKEISQIRDESKQFSAQLGEIIEESEAAGEKVANINAPKMAESTKELTEVYYSKLAEQAGDLKGIIDYMGQIIDVAAVFGEIKENASLDEMKNLIAQAKEKGSAVKTDVLPQNLQLDAQNLKDSMNSFLLRMEETAALKSENTNELDASYNDFSQKEDDFFLSSKKYIDGMESLDIMGDTISVDVERLGKVKFSLK